MLILGAGTFACVLSVKYEQDRHKEHCSAPLPTLNT